MGGPAAPGGMLCNLDVKALSPTARIPTQGYRGDAGYDLYVSRPVMAMPGEYTIVHTDIAIALSDGFYARILGRSSTIKKRNLLVVEGIIDNGYRGELSMGVFNPNKEPVQINLHDRVAQLIIVPQVIARISATNSLPVSYDGRGENGFGSTGN